MHNSTGGVALVSVGIDGAECNRSNVLETDPFMVDGENFQLEGSATLVGRTVRVCVEYDFGNCRNITTMMLPG